MKKNVCIRIIKIAIGINILDSSMVLAQNPAIREAARIGQPMPEFELVSYQGERISLSQLKGKNILLLFPRGRFRDQWCRYCHYQYAELVELERESQIRDRYNLEILQVMPYTKNEVENWVNDFERNLGEIEAWKNPPDPENLSPPAKNWMETARGTWPKVFDYSGDDIPTPFPILIDADRKVSIGLELFRTEWNLNRAEQNVPTIFIIDKDGILRFKYMSQSTMDRPSADYILKFIECMFIDEKSKG